ncbi:MAG: gliding motility-associated C-terminal domain-containing protein [Bacteroidales bacterium]|nr:gliding motility-associated C-terminal domain-containing protein [Bacteroidales bacterium]
MDNKLRNYSSQPDPEVWNKIRKTLRRQELRRQMVGGSIGAVIAVAAIVAVSLWPYNTPSASKETVVPTVAQVTKAPAQATPAMEQEVEAAKMQVQQPFQAPSSHISKNNETAVQQASLPSLSVPVVPSNANGQVLVVEPESYSAEENVPAVVAQPIAFTEPTPAKVETPAPAQVETNIVENKPIKQVEKNTINNGVIEDTILWVPNAFAPSSDNPDITTFRARLNKADASVSNYRITIFNRQGHQVFHSIDINQSWDGTYKGRALPQGGYVYVIYYVDKDGLTHQRRGTVALIR